MWTLKELFDSVNHPLTEKIDKDFIEKAEEAFEESIKEQCIKTIKKMQDLVWILFILEPL